jgi:hypothetical protein
VSVTAVGTGDNPGPWTPFSSRDANQFLGQFKTIANGYKLTTSPDGKTDVLTKG